MAQVHVILRKTNICIFSFFGRVYTNPSWLEFELHANTGWRLEFKCLCIPLEFNCKHSISGAGLYAVFVEMFSAKRKRKKGKNKQVVLEYVDHMLFLTLATAFNATKSLFLRAFVTSSSFSIVLVYTNARNTLPIQAWLLFWILHIFMYSSHHKVSKTGSVFHLRV